MYARESAKQGEQVRHQVSCVHLEQRENVALQSTFPFFPGVLFQASFITSVRKSEGNSQKNSCLTSRKN